MWTRVSILEDDEDTWTAWMGWKDTESGGVEIGPVERKGTEGKRDLKISEVSVTPDALLHDQMVEPAVG